MFYNCIMYLNNNNENINIVIAKAWFYLLQVSVVMGAIRFFGYKYNVLSLKIIFWLSTYFLYQIVHETLDETDFNIFPKKSKGFRIKFNALITAILSMGILLVQWFVIYKLEQ